MRYLNTFIKQNLSVMLVVTLMLLLLSPNLGQANAAEVWQNVVAATRLTSAIGDSENTGMAMDGFGNIHVAWFDYRHGNSEIYYTKLDSHGNTLVDDTRLTSGGNSYGNVKSVAPCLGVDSLGNIHIAWVDYRDNNWEIYYTKLDNNGNTLIDDTRLTDAFWNSYSPSLGIDSSDNIHIAWEDWRKYSPEIYYTKLDNNGNTLVDDTRLTSNSGESETPKLGIDGSNNIHITWRERRDGNREVYYTKLDNNGNTMVDDTRLTSTTSISDQPVLGIDTFGNIHIAWTDNRDGNFEAYYTKLDNNGNTLVDDTRLTYASGDSGVTGLYVDSYGNIHIVWGDNRDGNPEIYYTKLDNNGNTLVDDTRLTSNNAFSHYSKVVADDSGNIHIVWSDEMDGNMEVYYTKGITVTAPAIVIPSIDNSTPHVGEAVCVQVNVADVNNLYAASFDLTYNPAVLDYTGVTEGTFLNSSGQVSTSMQAAALNGNISSGQIVVGISRMGDVSGASGSGRLATLCFTVTGNYCATSDIAFGEANLEGPAQDSLIAATWNSGSLTVTLGSPANPVATDPGNHNQVNLCWDTVAGATSYEVYRSHSTSGVYTLIGTTANTCYQDVSCVLPTLSYYYQVKAVSGGTCVSAFSPEVSGLAAGLLGDINTDHRVDGRDLSRLGRVFGTANDCRSDLDRSGLIDGEDLILLAADFGKTL